MSEVLNPIKFEQLEKFRNKLWEGMYLKYLCDLGTGNHIYEMTIKEIYPTYVVVDAEFGNAKYTSTIHMFDLYNFLKDNS